MIVSLWGERKWLNLYTPSWSFLAWLELCSISEVFAKAFVKERYPTPSFAPTNRFICRHRRRRKLQTIVLQSFITWHSKLAAFVKEFGATVCTSRRPIYFICEKDQQF